MKLAAPVSFIASTFICLFTLSSCGGGGGGSAAGTPVPPGGCVAPTVQYGNLCVDAALFTAVDSLNNTVDPSFWTASSRGGGGSGDGGGADGSAGDGAPIANASVVLKDNAGHTATTTTDANGYYRINTTGFTPPFVVKVTRADGTEWYSGSTQGPAKLQFVTMNITGLTDKTVGYVADAINLNGGSAQVTPNVLASNQSVLQTAKTRIATSLTSPLTYVGLPTNFDPIAFPYAAVKTDKYDRLLERLIASKDPSKGSTVVVGTFAGVRESFLDGPISVATFHGPLGVAVDSNGNLFVADFYNNAIRKITPTGVVSTFAGNGLAGFTDGAGVAASFSAPTSVAVDSNGNVFVADFGNNAIRKITSAGVVSTFAGSAIAGFANGTGSAASFNGPSAVALDSSGNVFVGDRFNSAIRKITPAGVVSTLAGSGIAGFTNGAGTAANFDHPQGVAVDNAGNVYVADTLNYAIRKITPAGTVSTLAGSGTAGFTDGSGIAARFNVPQGVAVDSSGNVFVADGGNYAIRKITSVGTVSTLAGSGGFGFANGTGTSANFGSYLGIAVDSSGKLFVGDSSNESIRAVTPSGVVSTLVGSPSYGFSDGTGTSARFSSPHAVALDRNGNVFVADRSNNAIRKITPAGVVSTFAGSGINGFTNGNGTAASFYNPGGIAIDSSGNLFVADQSNNVIRKITPAGVVSTFAGSGTSGNTNGTGTSAQFSSPHGIVIDSSGNFFVTDQSNNVIRKITPAGVVSTFAGSGTSGYTNGTGTSAQFNFPRGIAIDSSDNLYVAENYDIRKVTPAGIVSTLAGSGSFGFSNGTGTAASFSFPEGVAVDNSGNVFVADGYNNAIRKITSAGVVSTVSGDGNVGYINSTGKGARFNNPTGVAADHFGSLFVADESNYAIRLILP